MNMEELPEYIFDDEKDAKKNEDGAAQTNGDSLKRKYSLTLEDDDDCNNCSL